MGFIDRISDVFEVKSSKKGKQKPKQTVKIKVKMDCDGCKKKVEKAVSSIEGATSVDVNKKESKVTVIGYVKPNKVLDIVKGTGKTAEFWPYIEYNNTYYPYAPQAYDRKAPSGFVRNVPQAFPSQNDLIDPYYYVLFSDENVDSCSIM